MKKSLFLMLCAFSKMAFCQTTDDMLNSRFAKKYILIRANPQSRADNQNLYQIDGVKWENREFKGCDDKLNISVSTRGGVTGELAILVDYLNPFKYRIRFSDSTYSDPSFTNMAKFTNSLVNLSELVTNQTPIQSLSQDNKPIKIDRVEKVLGDVGFKEGNTQAGFICNDLLCTKIDDFTKKSNDYRKIIIDNDKAKSNLKNKLSKEELEKTKLNKMKLDLSINILKIRSPDFIEWKYLYQKDIEELAEDSVIKYPCLNESEQLKDQKNLIEKINIADTLIYDGNQEAKGSFLNILKLSLDKMRDATTLEDFKESYERTFKPNIKLLKEYNTKSSESLESLIEFVKSNEFYIENSEICNVWAGYTKSVVSNFYSTSDNILIQRKKVIQELETISGFIENFLQVNGGKRDKITEETIVARSKVSQNNMKNLTVYVQEREILFNNGIQIKDGKVVSKTEITLSSYKNFIVEFSPSLFFTNMDYQVFGTKVENGLTKITTEESNKTNYAFAANFNFIYNRANGKSVGVNPMFQVGVGVTKDRPSLLLGGGLRFSKSVFISLGAMFTWKRELDKLKVDQVIDNSALLEKDLYYNFNPKPYFYLGIGYNLKKI